MGFSAEWLTLRESADHAARNKNMLKRAVCAAGPEPVILDLGSGTGSTVRALKAHLPNTSKWRLVDSDFALLRHAASSSGTVADTFLLDITNLDALPFEGVTLVTASALLDLVSATWIEKLATRLEVPFYAALAYDGQMCWTPAMAEDEDVRHAFNAHQKTDKGMGPALGPNAVGSTASILEKAGFNVTRAESPWLLEPVDTALQKSLVEGVAFAAHEAGHPSAADWGRQRCSVAATSHCRIGHSDLLAIPAVKESGGVYADYRR
jgi:hypothetical protein